MGRILQSTLRLKNGGGKSERQYWLAKNQVGYGCERETYTMESKLCMGKAPCSSSDRGDSRSSLISSVLFSGEEETATLTMIAAGKNVHPLIPQVIYTF